MNSTPQVAVIVPSHRAEGTIGACLDALGAQTFPPERFEVRVIDTGEDGTEALIAGRAASWNGRLHYHRAEGTGPGEKRNLGAELTSAGLLAFTDSDCIPEPDWLTAGVEQLERGSAIVQGPTLTPDGSAPPPFSHAIGVSSASPLYESCNVMYEVGAFRKAGGFPVDLFELTAVPFGEDTELAWRVLRAGGTAVFEPRATVRHVVHALDYPRHLRYMWQTRYFPHLVKRVPELRRESLTAGLFLGRRSLRTCGAIAALSVGRRHPLALALALPYLSHLHGVGSRARSPRAAGVGIARHVISDVVREGALISGSLRFRSPVL